MKRQNIPLVAALAVSAGVVSLGLLRRYRRTQAEALAWKQQRLSALDVLACPACHGALSLVALAPEGGYLCPACQQVYPVVDGIPHFIETQALTGLNQRFAHMYDWFSWGYRLFSKVAFAYIGMSEADARREVTDRLDPQGGPVLEVSIGPGVNLPYLVGRPDVGAIYGLDISPGQLYRCREYVAHLGWDTQLQLGNAEQLPYQDNTFAGVFHLGGINFFNDQQKAIAEMIRVAKPGTRLLICDENEKGAQAYARFLPNFKRLAGGEARPPVVPPLDLVPPEMQEVRLFEVWNGWMYCLEFRKPHS
jgi:ubiquinone/menaquinone biosynthesis C-methylase UbiE